jgi:hypothetical protein
MKGVSGLASHAMLNTASLTSALHGMQPPPTQADLISSPDDGLNSYNCRSRRDLDRSLWAHHVLIVLCRLVVRVLCQSPCTTQYSVVQCGVLSPQVCISLLCGAVYIRFAACSLTTNLQSTISLELVCSLSQ